MGNMMMMIFILVISTVQPAQHDAGFFVILCIIKACIVMLECNVRDM
jgi:hypothetical protein